MDPVGSERADRGPALVELPASKGARRLPDGAAFDGLARRDDVPGALGAREAEFLMTGVDGPGPQLFFINTMNTPYHYDLATEVLGIGLSLEEFNGRTYFRADRQNLAGSIIAHDNELLSEALFLTFSRHHLRRPRPFWAAWCRRAGWEAFASHREDGGAPEGRAGPGAKGTTPSSPAGRGRTPPAPGGYPRGRVSSRRI